VQIHICFNKIYSLQYAFYYGTAHTLHFIFSFYLFFHADRHTFVRRSTAAQIPFFHGRPVSPGQPVQDPGQYVFFIGFLIFHNFSPLPLMPEYAQKCNTKKTGFVA